MANRDWEAIVIGCKWGRNLASAAENIKGVEVSAVVDLNLNRAQELAEEIETEPYENYKQAIAEQNPDVALIAVDNQHHCQVALECIEAGLHIYLEKPCGREDNPEEVMEINRTAKKKGLSFMPGYSQRFAPYVEKTINLVETDFLGEIYAIDILRQANFMPNSPDGPGWGIHDYDICCVLAGSGPDTVSAFFPEKNGKNICNSEVIVKHENGVLSRCKTSTTSFSLEVLIRVYGSKGELQARRTEQTVVLKKEDEECKYEFKTEKAFWERAVEKFFSHLKGEKELPIEPREVLRGRKILAAASQKMHNK